MKNKSFFSFLLSYLIISGFTFIGCDNSLNKDITLSGTVNIKVDGSEQYLKSFVYAYLGSSGNEIKGTQVNNDGTWSMNISALEKSTKIFFDVDYIDGTKRQSVRIDNSINVYDSDVSNIDLKINLINLSGTAKFIMNENHDNGTEIIFFIGEEKKFGNYATDENDSWAIKIPVFDQPTEITFSLKKWDSIWQIECKKIIVFNTSIREIDLIVNVNTKILTGTTNKTNEYILYALSEPIIFLYDLDSQNGNSLSKFMGLTLENNGNWSISILDTAPVMLWFIIAENNYESNRKIYITKNAIDCSSSIFLDINQMNPLPYH